MVARQLASMETSMKRNLTRVLFPVLCCLLLTLLAGCGSNAGTAGTGSAGNAAKFGTPGSTMSPGGNANPGTQPMPATQTSCPAAGTARAAVMAGLASGRHNNLVYVVNEYTSSSNPAPTAGTLKRYDVATGIKTVIVGIPHVSIESAQVSADGKWMLFTTSDGALRLVRMDGQGLQTLFCAAGGGISPPQWSSDQRHVIFSVNQVGNSEAVYLLTMATGELQTELSIPLGAGQGVSVGTWLDTSRVYLTNYQIDQPHNRIYILDTRRGPNQSLSSLPALINKTFGDFDSSYDGRQLYVDYGYCGMGGCYPPSNITVQPATGGAQTTILNEPHDDVIGVRAVTASTLLLLIRNDQAGGPSDASHNGLWKIASNGSGLTRLTSDPAHQYSSLNNWTQFPWSNLSRDGGLYALQVTQATTQINSAVYTIEYGSLSGGAPTVIASIGAGTTLQVAGWTSM
jgi:hypothetical protein